MRINEHIAIKTSKLSLIPYCKHHVPKYHQWMQNPTIQVATASDPLTLEEEYAMQASWRVDADKLTFIICQTRNDSTGSKNDAHNYRDEVQSMVGDVNMFISLVEQDDTTTVVPEPAVIGELELMIAEQTVQRRGYGRAALLTFMKYILAHQTGILQEFWSGTKQTYGLSSQACSFSYFAVKIGQDNHRSLALFESLGFQKVSELPSYFGEFELHLQDLRRDRLEELMKDNHIDQYEEESYIDNRNS